MGSCISYPTTCPAEGDLEANLLGKILQVLNGDFASDVSSVSVNGGPALTGAVSLTMVTGLSVNGGPFQTGNVSINSSDFLLNFTDENADADAVIWRNSGATEVLRAVGASGDIQISGASTRFFTTANTDQLTFLASSSKSTGSFFEVMGQGHASGAGATISMHQGGQFQVRSAPVSSTVSLLQLNLDATSGFLGVGPMTAPVTQLMVQSTSASDPRGIMTAQYSADTIGARIHFRKSRGATAGTDTAVVSGDVLGRMRFSGYDGSNYLQMASIDATVSAVVAGTKIPTSMSFSVATNATPSVLTERVRIDSDGLVNVIGGNILLDNNQSYRMKDSGGTSRPVLNVSAADNLLVSPPPGGDLYLNTSAIFTLKSTGPVGIGTASPQETLSIVKSATLATFAVYETSTVTTNYSKLKLETQAGNHRIYTDAAGTGLTAGKPRVLQVGTGPSVGTDIAGQDVIWHTGQGTGTGVPGKHLFQLATIGSTGSSANALATGASLVRESTGVGLIINSTTGTLNSLGSGTGLDIYGSSTGNIAALNYINSSTGTTGGLALQFILTNSGGTGKRAGTIIVSKEADWASGANEDAQMVFRLLNSGTDEVKLTVSSTSVFTFIDAANLGFGTGTGTKIGTATTQKLSLWNKAPDVQPTNAIAAAAFVANTSLIANDSATYGGYTMGQIAAALIRIGALA